MKKIVILSAVLLFVCGCYEPVFAGDKEDFQKEREQLIARISEYEVVVQNINVRIAQLDFGIALLQKQEAEKVENKKSKKKPKKVKKAKKAEKKKNFKKAVIPINEEIAPAPKAIK